MTSHSRRTVLKGLAGTFLGYYVTPALAKQAIHQVKPGTSIQAAIDRAAPGDTVLVAAGVYHETVVINKPLTLRSVAGYQHTILNADKSRFVWQGLPREDYVVGAINVVSTEDVIIDGFTLHDALEGCWVSASRRVLIENCMSCDHLSSGYYFWASQESTVRNSIGEDNAVGVYQGGSVDIAILNNLFRRNDGGVVPHLDNDEYPGIGILLGNFSTGCRIVGNHCVDNVDWGVGISTGITDVQIISNELRSNRIGVFLGEEALQRRNNIVDNKEFGLKSGLGIDARYNWWGDASGPSGAGPGTGDAVMAAANYEPWLTEPAAVPDFAVLTGEV